MNHSFNVEIAKEYGLHEAIILENLYFWIAKNIANGQNYYDGHYWTYNSVKAFNDLFPYMSSATIRRVLANLEKGGLIITGNYNKLPYDRTKWYALTDKAFALFKSATSICSNQHMDLGRPEQATNTDAPQIATGNMPAYTQELAPMPQPNRGARKQGNYTAIFEDFWNAYPRREEKAQAYKQWRARLKDGYSPDELIIAAKAYAESCRRNHTEKQFTKQAKTFLGPNTPFLDWLPKTTEGKPDASGGAGGGQPSTPQDDEFMRQLEQQLMETAT